MDQHSAYKFSITSHSDDLAVVNCLRSLAQYSQKTGNNRIPWGGTKDRDWMGSGHSVTFRFTEPQYRVGFVAECSRLLGTSGLWKETASSDADPAQPMG